jgi:hypothetical protein
MFACDAPWYFGTFYRLILPFIHPVTKSKIRFVDTKSMHSVQPEQEAKGIWSNLLTHIDEEQLEVPFGGGNRFEYDHNVYWPLFTADTDGSDRPEGISS